MPTKHITTFRHLRLPHHTLLQTLRLPLCLQRGLRKDKVSVCLPIVLSMKLAYHNPLRIHFRMHTDYKPHTGNVVTQSTSPTFSSSSQISSAFIIASACSLLM